MLRDPPLESLRILEVAVRLESFTKAAAELNVSPAAVSLRMRNLEAELEVELFERSGPSITPTPAARTLADEIAAALSVIRSGVLRCRSAQMPVRLTCAPSIATHWLAPRLSRLAALPDASLLIVDSSTDIRQEFDIAIRTGDEGRTNCRKVGALRFTLTPMANPSLVASVRLRRPRDLLQLPLLANDDWELWFREAGEEQADLQFAAGELPTYELDAAAAINGAGVALLPLQLFSFMLEEGLLVRPFPQECQLDQPYHVLVNAARDRPEVRDIVDHLLDEGEAGPDQ